MYLIFLTLHNYVSITFSAPPTFYTTPTSKGCLEEIALSDKAALLYFFKKYF